MLGFGTSDRRRTKNYDLKVKEGFLAHESQSGTSTESNQCKVSFDVMTINNGKGRLVCINWDGVDRSAWQLIFNFEQIAFLNLQMIPQSFQKLHIAPRWTLCVTADGRSAPTACTG